MTNLVKSLRLYGSMMALIFMFIEDELSKLRFNIMELSCTTAGLQVNAYQEMVKTPRPQATGKS